ncbi:MAG: hypothetical protein H6Q05_2879 [Acidobacteria bacterium]|jgi:hypothetical protein|nr:hypothetical protein [Acidobacteriota bacterium]
MSLLDLLQTVGGRLGILEAHPKTAAGEPEKVVTRTVTLEQLRTEIRADEVRALAGQPADLALPFDKIFEAAGVSRPASEWNILRVREILESERSKGRDRAAMQHELLSRLNLAQVSAEDVVKEAIAQDQALDAFEDFVRRKSADRLAMTERRIAELAAQIQALQGERAGLEARQQNDQRELLDWRRRKRAYERELAETVGYLTDRPVISTDTESPAEGPQRKAT